MLDLVAMKIRRSRSANAIFGERVTVVADASRAIDHAALTFPAAYVTFLSEQRASRRRARTITGNA